MRALVVGLNWGHVHINALRQLGHTVMGIVDVNYEKCRSVAAQYAIENFYSSLDEVNRNDFDVITIAVPAKYHFEVINKALNFNVPVICEKPVLGISGTDEQYRLLENKPLYFNYAYPFLEDIELFYKKIDLIQNIKHIEILCTHNLKLTTDFTDAQMFYETVSHPVALISHKLISQDIIADVIKSSNDTVTALLKNGLKVDVICRKDTSFEGIRHHITIEGDKKLELIGEYLTGSTWHYKPAIFDGNYIGIEHWPSEDPWYSANKRSLNNLAEMICAKQTPDNALLKGAFDLQKAMIIEKILHAVR